MGGVLLTMAVVLARLCASRVSLTCNKDCKYSGEGPVLADKIFLNKDGSSVCESILLLLSSVDVVVVEVTRGEKGMLVAMGDCNRSVAVVAAVVMESSLPGVVLFVVVSSCWVTGKSNCPNQPIPAPLYF